MSFLFVGLGGALGAMMRYAISLLPNHTTFPIWTFFTNVLGAILIGFVVETAMQKEVSPNTVLFLKTGVCGGFTTFSTFSLESYQLFQKGLWGQGGVYVACSVIFCLAGIWFGMYLGRLVH